MRGEGDFQYQLRKSWVLAIAVFHSYPLKVDY